MAKIFCSFVKLSISYVCINYKNCATKTQFKFYKGDKKKLLKYLLITNTFKLRIVT